jgi:hypothetical protein
MLVAAVPHAAPRRGSSASSDVLVALPAPNDLQLRGWGIFQ